MWTDQTIGAGETVAYQFTAQLIPENLDGVVNAWYVDGTSCSYTWENTEILGMCPATENINRTIWESLIPSFINYLFRI